MLRNAFNRNSYLYNLNDYLRLSITKHVSHLVVFRGGFVTHIT